MDRQLRIQSRCIILEAIKGDYKIQTIYLFNFIIEVQLGNVWGEIVEVNINASKTKAKNFDNAFMIPNT